MCAQRRIQTRSAHDRHGPTDSLGSAGAESYTGADGRARSNGRARRADGTGVWPAPVASCSLRPFRAFYTVIESRVELPRDTQTLLNASHKSSDAAREAGSSQASPAEAERHGSRSDKGMACCDISHARANGNRAYATAPARIKVHLSAFSWSSRLRGRGSQKS
jgi:hypothetical protein